MCLAAELTPLEHKRFTNLIKVRQVLQRGKHIFERGDAFRSLYFVRSGVIKCWNITEDGEEHIIHFHLPGDVVGLAAISSGIHDYTATVLEASSICEIPYIKFRQLACKIPTLTAHLLRIMSREINHNEQMIRVCSNMKAASRLAYFLEKLIQDYRLRGYSSQAFNLTMGRQDIANYLGLALETVSRTFSQLQDECILHVDGKYIEIRDQERLSKLSRVH